jgi:hypothetical protein
MNDFVEVARPDIQPHRGASKYAHVYDGLKTTLLTGSAMKFAGISRPEVNAIRMWFQAKNPGTKVVMRTLPDGIYLWAERRVSA